MADEREFSPARLEAISDGVIAVAITIMVLELHPPHEATWEALSALWRQFEAYVISFLFIATYWVNHRYLFRHMKRVDDRVLWSNMALLFLLSLIPFSTAYVGETNEAPFSTAVYACVMLSNGVAYALLAAAIRGHYGQEDIPTAFRGRAALINLAAVTTYALAIPAAYVSPTLALVMIFSLTLIYVTPLTRPE